MIALAFLVVQQTAAPSYPSAYWQQQVAYEIEARLDEPSGVLAGTERIRYTNRSPDTLTTFSLHLYLNAFRPGSRAQMPPGRGAVLASEKCTCTTRQSPASLRNTIVEREMNETP